MVMNESSSQYLFNLQVHIFTIFACAITITVLIIRRNEKPNPMEIPYQTMDDLKNKFKTDKTTYNEMLQKKKEEKEAIVSFETQQHLAIF